MALLRGRPSDDQWHRACAKNPSRACGAQQLSRINMATACEPRYEKTQNRETYCLARAVDQLAADGDLALPVTRCKHDSCSKHIAGDLSELARWCSPGSLECLCDMVGATIRDLAYTISYVRRDFARSQAPALAANLAALVARLDQMHASYAR